MALSMGISAEIVTSVGDVEGIIMPDGSLLPFDTQIQEIWVIHPEETRSGTCEDCAALAGEIFGVGEGDIPPIHAHCVCERVPIMDTVNADTGAINPAEDVGATSITMAEMANMSDDALDALSKNSSMDAKTITRAKVVLKRRSSGDVSRKEIAKKEEPAIKVSKADDIKGALALSKQNVVSVEYTFGLPPKIYRAQIAEIQKEAASGKVGYSEVLPKLQALRRKANK